MSAQKIDNFKCVALTAMIMMIRVTGTPQARANMITYNYIRIQSIFRVISEQLHVKYRCVLHKVCYQWLRCYRLCCVIPEATVSLLLVEGLYKNIIVC